MRTHILFAITVFAVAVIFAGVAGANDGQSPHIFEMVQQGQDVRIRFGYSSPGCFGDIFDPSMNSADVYRCDDEENCVLVGEASALCEEDGTGDASCDSPRNPCEGACVDCNGDGVEECPKEYAGDGFDDVCCFRKYFFMVDECVLPGHYNYLFESVFPDEEDIEVTEWDLACAGIDSGVDDEEDPDSGPPGDYIGDEDEGGGSSGCSTSGAGAGGPLAIILFAVGAAALFWSRRQRG